MWGFKIRGGIGQYRLFTAILVIAIVSALQFAIFVSQ